jgi:hypothetical protein
MRKNARKLAGLSFSLTLSAAIPSVLHTGNCVRDMSHVYSQAEESAQMDASAIEPEITDAMIDAGLAAYHGADARYERNSSIVISIYKAMTLAAGQARILGRQDDKGKDVGTVARQR